jgi:hypothetical protein
MTKRMIKKRPKSYLPHKKITEIMRDLLEYQDDLDVGLKDSDHKRYIDTEKVELLNDYIFPSMANIVFFFRFISRYPQLKKIFDNDVRDLLGVRRENPHDDNYGFIFSALVRSIVSTGLGFISKEEIRSKDFRLRLNQILQESVWVKAELTLPDVFKNPAAQRVVEDDFNRAWAWVRMLAEGIEQAPKDNKPPHRTIRFGIIELREDNDPL